MEIMTGLESVILFKIDSNALRVFFILSVFVAHVKNKALNDFSEVLRIAHAFSI